MPRGQWTARLQNCGVAKTSAHPRRSDAGRIPFYPVLGNASGELRAPWRTVFNIFWKAPCWSVAPLGRSELSHRCDVKFPLPFSGSPDRALHGRSHSHNEIGARSCQTLFVQTARVPPARQFTTMGMPHPTFVLTGFLRACAVGAARCSARVPHGFAHA